MIVDWEKGSIMPAVAAVSASAAAMSRRQSALEKIFDTGSALIYILFLLLIGIIVAGIYFGMKFYRNMKREEEEERGAERRRGPRGARRRRGGRPEGGDGAARAGGTHRGARGAGRGPRLAPGRHLRRVAQDNGCEPLGRRSMLPCLYTCS